MNLNMMTIQAGESTPDIAPLLVHRNVCLYIRGGGKQKYCMIRNFCSEVSWALGEGVAISGFDCTFR